MKQLVFIHGRAQQDKDPDALKRSWIDAWSRGLQKSGLAIPIPEDRIRFPYYGDSLRDMTQGIGPEEAASIVVRGAEEDVSAQEMLAALLEEYVIANRIGEDEIERNQPPIDGPEIIERGPQNWRWVQGILRTIDTHTPGGGALIALVTNDVYQYLNKTNLRKHIENGVASTFDPAMETVVVSHSLGTVIAYTLLRNIGEQAGWKVPVLITLGSPLGIRAIRGKLSPIKYPYCVGRWYNAMDPNDVVSLYPLDRRNFNINPPINNKTDVDNRTPNQHGIDGYLDDSVVAKWIYDALL